MTNIVGSSFEEFCRWYLRRERVKRNEPDNTSGFSDDDVIQIMNRDHSGKIRDWFKDGKWMIATLDPDDWWPLLILECDFTKNSRLVEGHDRPFCKDYRILSKATENAKNFDYFDNDQIKKTDITEFNKRQDYLNKFRRQWPPPIVNENRIVICTTSKNERDRNPSAKHYLHDGFGRMLAVSYLMKYEKDTSVTIEAFIAEEVQIVVI